MNSPSQKKVVVLRSIEGLKKYSMADVLPKLDGMKDTQLAGLLRVEMSQLTWMWWQMRHYSSLGTTEEVRDFLLDHTALLDAQK